LRVHISDFGKVGSIALPSDRGVSKIFRKLYAFWRIGGSVSHDPRGMRFSESDNETEWLAGITIDKFTCAFKTVFSGRISDTGTVKAGNAFKWEGLLWPDVGFASKTHAITQRFEMLWDAFGAWSTGSVIPCATVSQRVKSRVELGPTRRAHCHTNVCAVKNKGLLGKLVEVWGLCILPTMEREVAECTIIGNDEKDVWFPNNSQRRNSRKDKDQEARIQIRFLLGTIAMKSRWSGEFQVHYESDCSLKLFRIDSRYFIVSRF
jgi:hypothetical protein